MASPQTDLQRTGDRNVPAPRRPGDAPGDKTGDATRPTMPPRRAWLTFLVILAINYALARILFPNPDAPVKVPYTLFKQQAQSRNVQRIYSRGESLTGRFLKPVT
jgi:cell division protease FtsH